MKCSAYFGELSEIRRQRWEQDDTNPYEVLVSPICLEGKGHDLFSVGSQYFKEKIKVDWGSFAWKCTPEEIYRFFEEHQTTLPWLIKSDKEVYTKVREYVEQRGNTEYGVVFVEEM